MTAREGGTATKLPRRTLLHLAAGAAVLPAFARSAGAQSYPARPVRAEVNERDNRCWQLGDIH